MKLDEDDIQRIAERVVTLLTREHSTGGQRSVLPREAAPAPSGLVDAAMVARTLGVDRNWVYAHAKQLGGVRLGGPQGRLRFDLAQLSDRLAPQAGGASLQARTPAGRRSQRRPSAARRRQTCTPGRVRPKIALQTNTAGRRANAPGPTTRG